MTDIVIRPRADEKYDIYVHDSDNGNALLNSNQGYERAIDAEDQARKLFSDSDKLARIRQIAEFWEFSAVSRKVLAILDEPAEPTRLTVEYRDGTAKSELIR